MSAFIWPLLLKYREHRLFWILINERSAEVSYVFYLNIWKIQIGLIPFRSFKPRNFSFTGGTFHMALSVCTLHRIKLHRCAFTYIKQTFRVEQSFFFLKKRRKKMERGKRKGEKKIEIPPWNKFSLGTWKFTGTSKDFVRWKRRKFINVWSLYSFWNVSPLYSNLLRENNKKYCFRNDKKLEFLMSIRGFRSQLWQMIVKQRIVCNLIFSTRTQIPSFDGGKTTIDSSKKGRSNRKFLGTWIRSHARRYR